MSAEKLETRDAARSLARRLLADIALHNREDLRAGRDMTSVFEEARAHYAAHTLAPLKEVFEDELEAFVVRDASRPDSPSALRAQRINTLAMSATGLAIVALLVGTWWFTRTTGDAIAEGAIPGTLTFDAVRGDTLHFEVNHDVSFRAASLEDMPRGCSVDLALSRQGRPLATSHCDLFRNAEGEEISDAANAEEDEDGLTHIEVFDARIACTFEVTETGRLALASTSNLDTCVPKRGQSVLRVFRTHVH